MTALPLAVRIQQYLATLAPHVREREAALLLAEAEEQLNRISEREFVAQARAAIMGGWTSVSERLPDTPAMVILADAETVNCGWFYKPVGWSWAASLDQCEPTHWMPLPEPPEDA